MAACGTLSDVQSDSAMKYMVFKPKGWSSSGTYPVLVFLHGSGGVGKPENVRRISLGSMLLDPAYADKVGHIVLLPLATTGDWSNHFETIMQLVDMAVKTLGGDASRVAVAGQSMGGHGAWMLATQHARSFSAVVAICGYYNSLPTLAAALKAKPVWVLCARAFLKPTQLLTHASSHPLTWSCDPCTPSQPREGRLGRECHQIGQGGRGAQSGRS